MHYSYRAIDLKGKSVTGQLEADNLPAAERAIMRLGLRPYKTVETSRVPRVGGWKFATKPTQSDRAKFMRLLASLLSADITIDKAFSVIAVDASNRRIQNMARMAGECVAAGRPFSSSLLSPDLGYSLAETGQVRAAELTGKLSLTLVNLADELERTEALRSRIISALIYPAILMILAIASLAVVATVLTPSLLPIFEQSNRTPPLLLRLAAQASANTGTLIIAGTIGLGLLLVLRMLGKSPLPENVLLKSETVRLLEAARYCGSLGSLLNNGANIQTSVRLAAGTLKYASSRKNGEMTHERIVGGAKLATAANQLSFLDAAACQFIRVGEETNQLPAVLANIARRSETAAMQRIERAVILLTPALTVAIGILIGGLVMNVMNAILGLNELALQ